MNIRRFRTLHEAGASYAEIARECECDWRTVRRYVTEEAGAVPPCAPPRAGTQPRVITAAFEAVIEAWLRGDLSLEASQFGSGHLPMTRAEPISGIDTFPRG